jgi:hypothetical protein
MNVFKRSYLLAPRVSMATNSRCFTNANILKRTNKSRDKPQPEEEGKEVEILERQYP